MSQKFHINPETGEPGVCEAIYRACPLGGSPEEHYSTREEARSEYEKHMHGSIFEAPPKTNQEDDSSRVKTIAKVLASQRDSKEHFTVRSLKLKASSEGQGRLGTKIELESLPFGAQSEVQLFIQKSDYGRKVSSFIRVNNGANRVLKGSEVSVSEVDSYDEALAKAALKAERLLREQNPELAPKL